ncbi:MAG: phosphatase PAP2 family protein [Treponema sp.]|nr:phosphatase PAP2 family protein [Treponema sp.]
MSARQIWLLPAENTDTVPGIYAWGLEIIRAIQTIESPGLTSVMTFINELGTVRVYFPLILLFFWWIDERKGLRLGVLVIISIWLNIFMKTIFKQPRPFFLDPALGLAEEMSFGFPAGQAKIVLCFWMPVAAWLSMLLKNALLKNLIWAFAFFLTVIISFSSLYLGLYFPTDILAGWGIGAAILAVCLLAGPKFSKHFSSAGLRVHNISIAAIALAMNGLFPEDRSLPALFLGFCIGYTTMKSRFPFTASEEIKGKKPGLPIMLMRCLIGFLGLGIIYYATGLMLPVEGSLFRDLYYWSIASPFFEAGQFIRYGLLGLWASAGAPRIFQQMGLA